MMMMTMIELIDSCQFTAAADAAATCKFKMKKILMIAWCVAFLSTAAVHVSGLNQAGFSAFLEKAVIDMLGSDQYKVTAQTLRINITI